MSFILHNKLCYDNLYKTTNYSVKPYRRPLLLDIYVTSCYTKYSRNSTC